jgi:bacterioferritin-associated ferredoxin
MCAGLSENDIKKAIEDGYDTIDKLKYETGAALGCAVCQKNVEEIIINEYKKFPIDIIVTK